MNPSYVLLYVDNVMASADFYASLLEKKPVEASPGFAMFLCDGGLKFGLWKRDDVEPKAKGGAGTNEICMEVKDKPAVEETFNAWKTKGLKIAQTPTKMDFGYTFVALDPDGHRVRVFAAAAA